MSGRDGVGSYLEGTTIALVSFVAALARAENVAADDAAVADAPRLEWRAPDGCPTPDRVLAQIATLAAKEDVSWSRFQLVRAKIAGVCECSDEGCYYSARHSSSLTLRFSDDGLVGLFSNAAFVNERGFQQPLGTVHFRRETP